MLTKSSNSQDSLFINFTFQDEIARKFLNLLNAYDLTLENPEPLFIELNELFISNLYEKTLLIQLMEERQYEKNVIILLSSLFNVYFETIVNHNASYPGWLNDLLSYLKNPNHFGDTSEMIASQTNYSYSRLSTIFKSYLGITINQYRNDMKMIYAKYLLKTTNNSMLYISNELKYDSLSSFNHNFKEAFGITPLQYRKQTGVSIQEK